MGLKKGEVRGFKTGGRQKGTPNKTTLSVKQALEEAFERMGGVDGLLAFAQAQPIEFYKIWSKLLPRDLNVTGTINYAEVVKEARERISRLHPTVSDQINHKAILDEFNRSS